MKHNGITPNSSSSVTLEEVAQLVQKIEKITGKDLELETAQKVASTAAPAKDLTALEPPKAAVQEAAKKLTSAEAVSLNTPNLAQVAKSAAQKKGDTAPTHTTNAKNEKSFLTTSHFEKGIDSFNSVSYTHLTLPTICSV